MHVKLLNKTSGLIVVVLSCAVWGCRGHRPVWKDVVKRQAVDFLNAQGVSVKCLVVNNAGCFELDLRGSNISNLNVLEGMPIEELLLSGTSVRNLSPLKEMRNLRKLDVANTTVSDLSPLKGLALYELNITKTRVVDLQPIKGMPLHVLSLVQTGVRDFSHLKSLPLRDLYFSAEDSYSDRDIKILREKDSIRCINYYGNVHEFWSDYDQGKFRPPNLIKKEDGPSF